MRRFGLLAALLGAGARRDGPLRERLRGRFAAPSHAGSPDLPAGVRRLSDLAYGDDPAQTLDLYLPAEAQDVPLVLYVHGGGWQRGDKAMPQMVAHKVPHWTARGFGVASINYRMLPQADVLQQADDVARALAFVQSGAAGWGADDQRVALVGHSAGAHLATLVTADPALAGAWGASAWRGTVALDSAALDMVAVMQRPHFHFYDPVFGSDPAYWHQASPLHRMQGPPVAPLLLVCSSLRSDSEPAARAFAAKAIAQGGRADVLPVPLRHMELNDRLGLPGDYTAAVDAFLASVGIA